MIWYEFFLCWLNVGTNIIRDIGEDTKRGRIYIPLDELKKFNITEAEILKHIKGKKIDSLVKNQIERAQSFYKLAINNLPHCDKKTQKVGLMMGNIYYVLLSKISKDKPEKILTQKNISYEPLIRKIMTLEKAFQKCRLTDYCMSGEKPRGAKRRAWNATIPS